MCEPERSRKLILDLDPFPEPKPGAKIYISVETEEEKEAKIPPALPEQFNEITILGTQEELVWLAKQLLRVAHYPDDEFHTHLDREANAPVYRSAGDWWLTIGKLTKAEP
ncbi:MAG: hypothetical protein ACFCD0_21645 [Gemmataceae bacterium]